MTRVSKHFVREEFECQCGCGFDTVDTELIDVLEHLRVTLSQPIIITSGCRCPSHNEAIGGSKKSQHTLGRAVDFIVKGYDAEQVYNHLDYLYPDQYGLGKYSTWVHLDTRSEGPARWSG